VWVETNWLKISSIIIHFEYGSETSVFINEIALIE
jgi:hypothetical protein